MLCERTMLSSSLKLTPSLAKELECKVMMLRIDVSKCASRPQNAMCVPASPPWSPKPEAKDVFQVLRAVRAVPPTPLLVPPRGVTAK
jgi:hypothetical protein